MKSRFERSIEDNARMLRDHALREITKPDSPVRAFYLEQPGTRAQSTLIVFTPEGIALMGDLTPTNHGDVSALGYGLHWFTGNLGTDYLCSKFLEKSWVSERAVARLRDDAAEAEDDERKAGLNEIAADIDVGDIGQNEMMEALADLDIHDETYEIGMDYDPGRAGLLIAIQRRFAELFDANTRSDAKNNRSDPKENG